MKSIPVGPFSFLVHRPGRMLLVAVVATAVLVLGLAAAYVWGFAATDGGWNLLLVAPGIVAFVAIMRAGSTRCEVRLSEGGCAIASEDGPGFGKLSRAEFAWSDVVRWSWVGDENDELRIDLAREPLALVFAGPRAKLEAFQAEVRRRVTEQLR